VSFPAEAATEIYRWAVNDELKQSWEQTQGHLTRARILLPGGGSDDLRCYQEYLDHNELGLACEELERAGERRNAPALFWAALADAASEMRLTEEAELYRRRSIDTGHG
jgi:hypothetical protein